MEHNQNGRLPLDEIEAFVEVAAAGSFTAAGGSFNISHSSLSRKVAYLESRLGCRLFDRKSKGVELTASGLEHFLRFRDALALIGRSLNRTNASDSMPGVRLSMLDSFAIFWQFRHHHAFMEQIGPIRLHYDVDARTSQFDDGTDLAVRFGLGAWPNTRSVPLMENRYRPMACAAIARELGPNATAEEILKFPLIHMKSEASWVNWLESRGVYFGKRAEDRIFNDMPSVIAAIENGLGVGLSRQPMLHLVDCGINLAHVSAHSVNTQATYHLVRDIRHPLREPARRVAEVMLQQFGIPDGSIETFLSD